jgi:cytochrome o ubiquinol oxidase subunit IV
MSKPITVATYINGFVLSVALTLAAYLLVVQHALSSRVVIAGIVTLALAQFMVQLVCFLHLGRETKPRWKMMVLLFMVMVVVILVFGSLWIMSNLDYNMNNPKDVNTYLRNQDGI